MDLFYLYSISNVYQFYVLFHVFFNKTGKTIFENSWYMYMSCMLFLYGMCHVCILYTILKMICSCVQFSSRKPSSLQCGIYTLSTSHLHFVSC